MSAVVLLQQKSVLSSNLWTKPKEPNIIRGGTPYLFHCDATYVAPPAGGNAVDVLSVDHSISYAYGRAYGRAYGVVEE